MQQASILLALGGNSGQQVPKFGVTPAEIAVLRAIHGADSVTDVDPLDEDVDRSSSQELARLNEVYRGAKMDDESSNQRPVVSSLFPGVGVKLPESFDDLDLNDAQYKATETAKDRRAKKSTKSKKTPVPDPIPGTEPEPTDPANALT